MWCVAANTNKQKPIFIFTPNLKKSDSLTPSEAITKHKTHNNAYCFWVNYMQVIR